MHSAMQQEHSMQCGQDALRCVGLLCPDMRRQKHLCMGPFELVPAPSTSALKHLHFLSLLSSQLGLFHTNLHMFIVILHALCNSTWINAQRQPSELELLLCS